MICYKVTHKYKLHDHYKQKDIGVYSSLSNAEKAIDSLKEKDGFKDTFAGFKIKKYFVL